MRTKACGLLLCTCKFYNSTFILSCSIYMTPVFTLHAKFSKEYPFRFCPFSNCGCWWGYKFVAMVYFYFLSYVFRYTYFYVFSIGRSETNTSFLIITQKLILPSFLRNLLLQYIFTYCITWISLTLKDFIHIGKYISLSFIRGVYFFLKLENKF